jgi:hypothetical protein
MRKLHPPGAELTKTDPLASHADVPGAVEAHDGLVAAVGKASAVPGLPPSCPVTGISARYGASDLGGPS